MNKKRIKLKKLSEPDTMIRARRLAKKLYNAYKKVDLRVEEFEGPSYRRITHLENSIKTGRLDQNLRYIE